MANGRLWRRWSPTRETWRAEGRPKPQNKVNTAADLGFLKPGLDVMKYADLSIVKEAAERLK